MKYIIKKLQPFGIELLFNDSSAIQDIDANTIEALLNKHHLLLVRRSSIGNKESLVSFSKKMGKLLEWEFGNVMEMKPKSDAKNYLFTKEKVPFHWDGAFYQTPRFLVFNCIKAPDINANGETLFTNTQSIIESLDSKTLQDWKDVKITYQTEKVAHYGGEITVNLFKQHPITKKEILRFAEPVMYTQFNPVKVNVVDYTQNESEKLIKQVSSYCYASKHCYTHVWNDYDLLIADNYALLHARNAFSQESDRHLRRIQIL